MVRVYECSEWRSRYARVSSLVSLSRVTRVVYDLYLIEDPV